MKLFGLTAQLSKTPGAITSPPPRLGAHTEEVLVGLGYTKEDVAALKEKGSSSRALTALETALEQRRRSDLAHAERDSDLDTWE